MENTNYRIVEVNGVKMQIDLRQAKVIENYKVGDSIKVLVKGYDGQYKSCVGTIIGFDNFEKNPTVVIAYLDVDYSSAQIKFLYFNGKTTDIEITMLNDWDVPLKKSQIISQFDKEESKINEQLKEIQTKRRVFETLFGKYFEQTAKGITSQI